MDRDRTTDRGKTLFALLRDRDRAVREAAQREIASAVARLGGDARAAAAELGLSLRTVRRWMDAYPATELAPDAALAPAAPAAGAVALPAAADASPGSAPEHEPVVIAALATAGAPARGPATPQPRERAAATVPHAAPAVAPAGARRPGGEPPVPLRPAAAARSRPARRSPIDDFAPWHRMPLGLQESQPAVLSRPLAPAAAQREALTFAIATAAAAPAGQPATAPPRPPAPAAAAAATATASAATATALHQAQLQAQLQAPLPAGDYGEWPHHQPGATPAPPEAVPQTVLDRLPRRLAFVLHAHLPWVLGHGTWPHGEDWLAEAVVHCYLPLVTALQRLAARGGRHLLAFSVSPVLAAQLADPRVAPLVEGYLAHRGAAARDLAAGHPLAGWWESRYGDLLADWRRLGGDLLGALRRLEESGAIELSTCAATHGYLPLLHRPEHVTLQVRAARHNHRRWFGRDPAGLWMPECAYRPGGSWQHPVTGAHAEQRPGNESFLAAEGLRWTVVDAHLLLGGEPLLPYALDGEGTPADLAAVAAGAPAPLAARLQPHRIGDSDLGAMVREPHAAQQVWSRHGGYPGDPRYLDFHKRHAASGLRLWRVTDPAGDLGDKLPYHAAEATAAAREHAAHFVAMLAELPGLGDGVAACPYDAELFGHWWFEGPQWLEAVLAATLEDGRVTATTPARELTEHPPRRAVRLLEGSWGEAGDHRVWVNDATAWMWRELGDAEERVAAALAAGIAPERARALLAQLLLLAASDWPFLVTTGTAADYATARFRTHAARLRELLARGDGEPLPPWAGEDLAALTIDPAWWEMEPR